MRADLGLVGLDDGVERGRLDVAFLSQNRFERAHADLHFGQFRAVLMIVVVVVMVVCHAGLLLSYYIAMNAAQIIRFAALIDRLNTVVARAASWCALVIVLLGFAVVLLRYVLGVGSIWLQEAILYAHAALFLLAAAWTLKEGGHVRVDVFYADASAHTKALVDLFGTLLLLLPFCVA